MTANIIGDPEVLLQVDREKGRSKVEYGVQYKLNVAPHLNQAAIARAREERQRRNPKNELRRIASLDWVTIMAIKKKYGIDPLNCKGAKAVRMLHQILQREYPKFLTTNQKIYRPPTRRPRIPAECLAPDLS